MGNDIGRLLEVGVAVNSLEPSGQDFSDLFHAPISDVVADESNFAIRFKMCRLGDVDFEIMETTRPDGLIRRFIDRNGEGLHHIAFLVEDAERLLEDMKARGVPVLSERPVHMANLKAFFVHPAGLGGILFEFVENLHPWLDGKSYIPRDGRSGATNGFSGARIVGVSAKLRDLHKGASDISRLLGASCVDGHSARDLGQSQVGRIGNIALSLFEADAPISDAAKSSNEGGPVLGLHHVSIEVDNIDEVLEGMKADKEHQVLGTITNPAGFHETLVRSRQLHGMLIGLVGRE